MHALRGQDSALLSTPSLCDMLSRTILHIQVCIYFQYHVLSLLSVSALYFTIFCRGSAIAKIIGSNVTGSAQNEFESTVNMYVYEEMFEGRKLSEVINTDHENKKYLPGIKLPENVVGWKTLFHPNLFDHPAFHS